jgi:hypothetical protein
LLDWETIENVYFLATKRWPKVDRRANPVFGKYEDLKKCGKILEILSAVAKMKNDFPDFEKEVGVLSKEVMSTIENVMLCKNSIKVAIRLALIRDAQREKEDVSLGEMLIPN